MEHDGITFHNVGELVPVSHPAGLALYRYPREVRSHLSTLGHHAAACSDGVELRLVCSPAWVTVTLSAQSNYPFSDAARIRIYRGDILVEETTIPDGATRTLKLMEPAGMSDLDRKAFEGGRFSPHVWRIVTAGATVIYHGVEAVGEELRPPNQYEVPKVRMLAYGSSITNSTPGYAEHCVRHLGVDLINKGLSGSCWCEPEVADCLPGCDRWDFVWLELGINMRGGFTAARFEELARNLITTIRQSAPEKPMVVTDIFPNGADYAKEPNSNTESDRLFGEAIRCIHADLADPKIHYVNAADVLTSFSGLSADLVHPSPDGHQLMGRNLAEIIRGLGIV